MKTRNLILWLIALIILCGGVWYYAQQSKTPTENPLVEGNLTYISKNTATCEQILWTCPPKQAEFSDAKGCGCEPSEAIDDEEYRSLNALVQRYLSKKVMTPSFGGQIFADFKFLDNVANEETGNVEYNVWALVSEYYPTADGKLIKQGTAMSMPIVIEIEETGRAYIIRGHKIPADGTGYADSVKAIFSKDAQAWIFSQEDHSVIIKNLVNSVRSQASMTYALPIDDSDTLQDVSDANSAENTETANSETLTE